MSTAARGGKRAVPGRAGGARARPPGTVSKPAGEDAGTETQTGALVSRAAWPAIRSGADGPRGAGSSRGQCLHGASGAT